MEIRTMGRSRLYASRLGAVGAGTAHAAQQDMMDLSTADLLSIFEQAYEHGIRFPENVGGIFFSLLCGA
jgi:hypothetical protein